MATEPAEPTHPRNTLLIFPLKGALPGRYEDCIELKGALANIDLTKLPDDSFARIAQGEHPLSVLASASRARNQNACRAPRVTGGVRGGRVPSRREYYEAILGPF